MSNNDINQWLQMILFNSELVFPKRKLKIVLDDPDDDQFFEAAYESKTKVKC
jgi:predicted nucleic acid-binding protein